MAEFVQQSIEEMLPELEQMERVGLFTSAETRAILRKRKAYEYKLRRKTKQKEDYLQYAQYEVNVLALVRKRREKIGYKHKRLQIDQAVVHRINRLFRLAESRFKDDVKLWLSHIDFNKNRGAKDAVSKLFTKMIQIHNKKPALWIAAAKWEMEEGMSMENARSFLQRAIRFNPASKKLWIEYFRMELLNADKLRKRRAILGIAQLEKEEEEMSDSVLEGRIATVIFKKATEAFPDDVGFWLEFVPICQLFDFTGWLEDDIFKDLQERHPDNELTWDGLAKRPLQRAALHAKESHQDKKKKEAAILELEDECWRLYEHAVQVKNTEKMWSLYLNTCLNRLTRKNSSQLLVTQRVKVALSVFQRAADLNMVSESLMEEWVKVLLNIGQVEQLEKVLSLVTEQYPNSSSLWRLSLMCRIQLGCTSAEILPLMDKAMSQVPSKELLPVWRLVMEWSTLNNPEAAEKFLQLGVCQGAEVCEPAKEDYLEWACLQGGIARVRELYHSLSSSKPLSLKFFQTYITLENSEAKPKIKRLREAYEDAVREFGTTNTDLWLEYIELEMNHPRGRPEKAGKLHWRAMKALLPELVERFTAQYTLLQTGHL